MFQPDWFDQFYLKKYREKGTTYKYKTGKEKKSKQGSQTTIS